MLFTTYLKAVAVGGIFTIVDQIDNRGFQFILAYHHNFA